MSGPPEIAHSLACKTPDLLDCECLPLASASAFARTLKALFKAGKDGDAVGLVLRRDNALRERADMELTEALRQRDERTGDALGLLNRATSAEEERDAALRAVEEQRHPCPCGKDTASIKWARCYSCRQAEAEEMEALRGERDAAANLLAVIHRDGGHHTTDVGFVQSCADAQDAVVKLLERAESAIYEGRQAQNRPAGPHIMVHRQLWEQMKEECNASIRERDELLAKIREATGDSQQRDATEK